MILTGIMILVPGGQSSDIMANIPPPDGSVDDPGAISPKNRVLPLED